MCSGLLGLLLGHKFRPRYDYSPPVGIFPDLTNGEEVKFFAEKLITRSYCVDVCERCGIRNVESLRPLKQN